MWLDIATLLWVVSVWHVTETYIFSNVGNVVMCWLFGKQIRWGGGSKVWRVTTVRQVIWQRCVQETSLLSGTQTCGFGHASNFSSSFDPFIGIQVGSIWTVLPRRNLIASQLEAVGIDDSDRISRAALWREEVEPSIWSMIHTYCRSDLIPSYFGITQMHIL